MLNLFLGEQLLEGIIRLSKSSLAVMVEKYNLKKDPKTYSYD